MAPGEHYCTQEQRITSIEESVNGIKGQLTGLVTDVALLSQKVSEALKNVEEHDRALKGSEGSIGIIGKVTNALEVLADLQIALRGKEDKPGLISVITNLNKKIEEWEDTRKWITRLIIGWFITSLLGLLIIALK